MTLRCKPEHSWPVKFLPQETLKSIPLQLTVPITTSDSSSMKQQAILEDQQGLFNINLLNDNKNNVYFERIAKTVVPEFTASQR